MTTTQIKLWRLMLERSYSVVTRIQGAATAAESSLSVCDDFYQYHFGRRFNPGFSFEPALGTVA